MPAKMYMPTPEQIRSLAAEIRKGWAGHVEAEPDEFNPCDCSRCRPREYAVGRTNLVMPGRYRAARTELKVLTEDKGGQCG